MSVVLPVSAAEGAGQCRRRGSLDS